eukprot:1339169-Rhodomonas_salina.1
MDPIRTHPVRRCRDLTRHANDADCVCSPALVWGCWTMIMILSRLRWLRQAGVMEAGEGACSVSARAVGQVAVVPCKSKLACQDGAPASGA